MDRNGPSKSPEARVLRDRDGDDGGPAVKAVAQTEMERGERGVALLVLVHVPPGGGRCQADEDGVVSRRISKVPEEVGGGWVGSRRISMVSRFRFPVPFDREGLAASCDRFLRGSGTSRPSAMRLPTPCWGGVLFLPGMSVVSSRTRLRSFMAHSTQFHTHTFVCNTHSLHTAIPVHLKSFVNTHIFG